MFSAPKNDGEIETSLLCYWTHSMFWFYLWCF